jgi:N-hydroxyarylamine O-acetyltransferase
MDVHAYLQRIGYQGPLEPNLDTLRALHRSHLRAVPFENLDISLGRPIVLNEARLFEKVVRRRRGGFCYELNGLFAALLRELGFDVQRLSARVATAAGGFGIEMDHMALRVQLEEPWLADVGFGEGFLEPLRLDERGEQARDEGRYRLEGEGDSLTYLRWSAGAWKADYLVSPRPYTLEEFDVGCRYHQTSPESPFTRWRVCTRPTPEGRITLSDMKLILTTGGERREQPLEDEAAYHTALREHFGIVL